MCLRIVKEIVDPPHMEEFEAWKLVESIGDQIFNAFYPPAGGNGYDTTTLTDRLITPGRWYRSSSVEILSSAPDGAPVKYESGFHCFTSRAVAIERLHTMIGLPLAYGWVNPRIVSVRARGIVAVGRELSYACDIIVAKEVMYSENWKDEDQSCRTS